MLQRISIQAVDGEVVGVVRVEGEIDLTNSRDVAQALLDHVADDSPGLVADLTGVSYVDSAGIRLFVDVADRMRRNRQTLLLAVPPTAPIRRTLAIVKMELLVPIYDTVDEAVQAITSTGAD